GLAIFENAASFCASTPCDTDSPERQSLLSRGLIMPASEPSRFRLTASGLALADEIIRELIRI
ncbi:MAG: hypothetical protein J6W47_07880, partial [Bacteroidales bacterium]|nr:hypothetical protein [Bacteroidales bacterium]